MIARVAGMLLACAAPAVAGPSGRVVRIERAGPSVSAPALCEVDGNTGHCYFNRPMPGDRLQLFNTERVIGEGRITAVEEPRCVANGWTIELDPTGGVASRVHFAIRDSGVTDGARALPASSAVPGPDLGADLVRLVVDRNGDGHPDLEVAVYGCDPAGNLVDHGRTTSSSLDCIDLWLDSGHGMRRANHVIATPCP